MSKPISITDKCEAFLNKKALKDENGELEETYSQTIERLLNIK